MRKLPLVFALAAIASLVVASPVAASTEPQPNSSAEQSFFSKINAERSSRGLRTLSWSSRMASIARNHSEDMARRGELHHNSNLADEVGDFSALSENVGTGPSVDAIHDAFMDSSPHRSAILGRFTQAGVGVMVDSDGYLWVTEVFYTPSSSSSSSTTTTTRRASTTTTVKRVRTATSPVRYEASASGIHELIVRKSIVAKPVVEPPAVQTVSALRQLSAAHS